jgi:hypothetical protein
MKSNKEVIIFGSMLASRNFLNLPDNLSNFNSIHIRTKKNVEAQTNQIAVKASKMLRVMILIVDQIL